MEGWPHRTLEMEKSCVLAGGTHLDLHLRHKCVQPNTETHMMQGKLSSQNDRGQRVMSVYIKMLKWLNESLVVLLQ